MSDLRVVQADDLPFIRWKNGGGLARDLLRWPQADDWLVRVSIADLLDDGPFSPYPGIDRWFGVLTGDGVELQWTRAVRRMDRGRKLLHFDGAMVPHACLMGGPVAALNVMARQRAVRVKVEPAEQGRPAPQGYSHAALFARDPLVLRPTDQAPLTLPAFSLAWGPRSEALVELPGQAHGWWIAFDREGIA